MTSASVRTADGDRDAPPPFVMRAWETRGDGVLRLVERAVPAVSPGEVLVGVEACGVCRTDLHLVDGELPARLDAVVPGHQAVGVVRAVGPDVHLLRPGDRVGIAWLRSTCGVCRECRSGRENLCRRSRYTGWDVDGGLAEYAAVPEAFAYRLPMDEYAAHLAPLLCAGIIGFRAYTRARVPPGGSLGIYGFGSSGHLLASLARASGVEVFVMTRGRANRELAHRMGIGFVGGPDAAPPFHLDAAIVFAPAGELVPHALGALRAGGTAVLAGIHMTDLPSMPYATVFGERDLRTVTSNTRADGDAFLRVAEQLRLTPTVTRYPFERADAAIADLRSGDASGSLVVTVD